MPNPPRSLGSVLVLAVVAVGAFGLAGWLLRDGSRAPVAVPPVKCPAGTETLAGHDFRTTPVPLTPCSDLRNTRFDGIDVSQGTFSGSDLRGASLRGVHAVQAEFIGADLAGVHLERASLSQADLRGADLEGAHLDHADLTQADLTGADLRGADLFGADLTQATVVGADLRDADLNMTGFTQAELAGADLRGASVWLTSSIQAQMSGVRIDPLQPGIVQLGVIVLAAAVAAAGVTIVRPRSKGWLRMIGIAVAGTALLSVMELVPLWTVKILGWDAAAAGILLIAGAVSRYRSFAGALVPIALPLVD